MIFFWGVGEINLKISSKFLLNIMIIDEKIRFYSFPEKK